MATFIMLSNLTDEGIKGIKDAPNRRAAVEKLVSEVGGKIVTSYLTMGSYDRITILDMPDGEAMARFALAFGAMGFQRTTTLRGFPDKEGQELIASMP